ncbi:MAG: TonB family protein [Vicinamibacterales bacterium]
MYFDFDDRYQDVEAVGSAISRREGVVLSVVVHVAIVAAMLLAPRLPWFQLSPEEIEARRLERARELEARRDENPRFVIVEPLRDVPAPAPPKAPEISDMDRQAAAPEIAERPENALPFSRGDTTERVEAAPEERARGRGPDPEPAPPAPERAVENAPPVPEAESAMALPPQAQPQPRTRPPGGALGEALRDLQKYVDQQTFNNPGGGVNEFGPAIQFDTKGVEFGPWIRRFVAQVKRNWLVPNAAMAMRGRVVIQFNVHRDGTITDLQVVRPSEIDSFNRAAVNALMMSNPTTPLPPEYPDDRAFFTVTFFYNESPVP